MSTDQQSLDTMEPVPFFSNRQRQANLDRVVERTAVRQSILVEQVGDMNSNLVKLESRVTQLECLVENLAYAMTLPDAAPPPTE